MPTKRIALAKRKKIEFYSENLSNSWHLTKPLFNDLQKNLELSFLKATAHFVNPAVTELPSTTPESENIPIELLIYKALASLKNVKKETVKSNLAVRMSKIESLKDSTYKKYYKAGLVNDFNNSVSLFHNAFLLVTEQIVSASKAVIGDQHVISVRDYSGFPSTGTDMKVKLLIHEIKCEDETDPEGGSDEILLSATIIQPGGLTTKTPNYAIGDFNESDPDKIIKSYPNPIKIAVYDVWKKEESLSNFPKACTCIIFFGEEDNGEFPGIVEDLYHEISKQLKKEIEKAVEAGVIYIAGSQVGGIIGGPLGALIANLAIALLDELFQLIKDIWEDDVFPPLKINTSFADKFSGFNGAQESSRLRSYIDGHGGRYSILYSWKLDGVLAERPSIGPPPAVPQGGATIYKNVYFDGESMFLKTGHYSFGAGATADGRAYRFASPFDNEIDSIKLDRGFYAQLFKTPDFTGEFMEVYSDHNVESFDDNWRDQISSIIVATVESRGH